VNIEEDDDTVSAIKNAQKKIVVELNEADNLFRRRLIVCSVQLVAGLCIVFIVTYLMPSAKWLWAVAGAVAALMLVYIFGHAHYTRHRLQAADARLSAAAEFAKCLDAERRAQR
jgi:uncharacterized membrane protein